MSMKVDEQTRVISNRDQREYLEMKHKRDTAKRIDSLERQVAELIKEVAALKGKGENN